MGYLPEEMFERMVHISDGRMITEKELPAFCRTYAHLDLLRTKDAWGRPCFYHPHVQSLWDGWKARAAL